MSFYLLPPSFLFAAFLLLPTGCRKDCPAPPSPTPVPEKSEEVILYLWQDPSTKTSAVTQLSTVFWGTTTGGDAEGSSAEVVNWCAGANGALSATPADGVVSTGRYIDAEAPGSRNYYVANVDFTLGSTTTLSALNTTDIVAGRVFDSSISTPSVTLRHIFARLGTLTLEPPAGYTISGISWSLQGKTQPFGTAGTYNLTNGSWSGCSGLGSATPVTSGSDLYLIPGTYTLLCRYTLSMNGQTQVKEAQADVTLQEGRIHHISGTAVAGSLTQLVLSVDIAPWGNSHTAQEDS